MLFRLRSLIPVSLLLLAPFSAHAQSVQWDSDIRISPAAPKAGERVVLQVRVRAGQRSTGAFSVVGGIDGRRMFRTEVAELQANRIRDLRFTWTATDGTHTVFFQVIAKGATRVASPATLTRVVSVQTAAPAQVIAPERAPLRRSAPVQINPKPSRQQVTVAGLQQPVCEGAPLPDIEAVSLTVSGSGRHGTPHQVSVVVVNRGQCSSGQFTIRGEVRVQGQGVDQVIQLGTKGVPSLEPCRSDTCSDVSRSVVFAFTPQYNHALYDFTVEADTGNSVNEFNEENNETVDDLRIDVY